MAYVKHIGLGIVTALCLTSCIESEVNFEPIRSGKNYSEEIATNVEVFYSDSAKMRVSVRGPELHRYIYKFKVEEEFPVGVHVEFFDQSELPVAWLDAKYAKRLPNEKRIVARDSVVLYNDKGGRIESSELIWDEKKQILHTDRFVQIIRPPADTLYSYGFQTNQSFTEYELYSVEGDMTIGEFSSKYSKKD